MVFRMTVQTQLVLQALLRAPGRDLYGLELADETGLLPGTAYPILARLENEGWVSSRWEDIDPAAEKRPARRYYRLTAAGTAQAGAAVTPWTDLACSCGWRRACCRGRLAGNGSGRRPASCTRPRSARAALSPAVTWPLRRRSSRRPGEAR